MWSSLPPWLNHNFTISPTFLPKLLLWLVGPHPSNQEPIGSHPSPLSSVAPGLDSSYLLATVSARMMSLGCFPDVRSDPKQLNIWMDVSYDKYTSGASWWHSLRAKRGPWGLGYISQQDLRRCHGLWGLNPHSLVSCQDSCSFSESSLSHMPCENNFISIIQSSSKRLTSLILIIEQ